MKSFLTTLLGICLATSLPAQGPADNPPATKRTAPELHELLGPIALYPDALVALILPASTAPMDVVLGARYVVSEGNPSSVEDKPWDSSVKALTRYPDTLAWLDKNIEWTTQVGDAFIQQPVEVMESIQQLRAEARALGNLVDTPQQKIVLDQADIRIIPAQANYIYEPRYDPEAIYNERPLAGPFLLFGAARGVGAWLNYDLDWRHRRLYRGDWHEGWDYGRDGNRRDRENDRSINNNLTNSRAWQPDAARHGQQRHSVGADRAPTGGNPPGRAQLRGSGVGEPREHRASIAHPQPIAGALRQNETVRRADPRDTREDGNRASVRTLHEGNPGADPRSEHERGAPKSADRGTVGDGRHERDARDHKKTGNEPGSLSRHDDAPPRMKEAQAKERADTPPTRHKEAPQHEEAKKHEGAPKHPETAKHEEPKHDEGKAHAQPAKEKGKKGDKKKDDDKEKKKD